MLIDLAGEKTELLPERAVYWPAQRMLVVADIHFGKAAVFRAHGLPVPQGTTTQNLDLLTRLVAGRDIARIVFLGDFLHAKAAHSAGTLAAIRAWRTQHAAIELTLVRGNHDAHAGDPPADLDMHVVDEPWTLAPFAFCHHPQEIASAYVLAGHIHPVYRLQARGDSLRLPCFVFGQACGVLPSFGAFTGGAPVHQRAGQRLFVATDSTVVEIRSPGAGNA